MLRRYGPAFLLPFAVACGGHTSGDVRTPCSGKAPTCLVNATDPCGPASTVPAVCDATLHEWSCPADARSYARAPQSADICRPFEDSEGSVASLGGSLVRVPTDDGRCLWIAESLQQGDGSVQRNVAFDLDRTAPFGICPSGAGRKIGPVVTIDGNVEPDVQVQLASGFRFGGATRVPYRLFRITASNPLGDDIGGGLGRWDSSTKRIVVEGPDALTWNSDLDLSDASFVTDDFAYLWGCPKPPNYLVEGCLLARLDANDAFALFTNSGFDANASSAEAVSVFESGPWLSSVVSTGGGYAHVYSIGFGSTLQRHVAKSIEGPWKAGSDLARCDLPSADPKAFCAGPVVHVELADPTRPTEYVVSYGVGSTSGDAPAARDHWPRLVWVE